MWHGLSWCPSPLLIRMGEEETALPRMGGTGETLQIPDKTRLTQEDSGSLTLPLWGHKDLHKLAKRSPVIRVWGQLSGPPGVTQWFPWVP